MRFLLRPSLPRSLAPSPPRLFFLLTWMIRGMLSGIRMRAGGHVVRDALAVLSAELFDATNPIESPFLNRLLELLRFQYAPLPRQSYNVTRPQNATCHVATRGAACGPMR